MLSWWIKERHNPQTGTYYVPYGQMTVAEAKKMESSLYGTNRMIRFRTKHRYESAILILLANGERVEPGHREWSSS